MSNSFGFGGHNATLLVQRFVGWSISVLVGQIQRTLVAVRRLLLRRRAAPPELGSCFPVEGTVLPDFGAGARQGRRAAQQDGTELEQSDEVSSSSL